MIEILSQSAESCIGFKMAGKLTEEDYEILFAKMDEAIRAHGKISLVIVMGDFKGWENLEAAKADYQMGTQQYRNVAKAAFIGEKKWQKWMVKMMDPFTRRTEERFFTSDELDDAWQWAQQT